MSTAGKIALTGWATLLFVVPVAAEEDIQRKTYTSKEELLRDYEPAAKRLMEAYSKIIIEADCTYQESPTKAPETEVYRFLANGSSLRLDVETPQQEKLRKRYRVTNPKHRIWAHQNAGEPVVLDQVGGHPREVQESIYLNAPLMLAAVNFYETSIVEWLRRERDVHFVKSEWVAEGDESLLKVWVAFGEDKAKPVRVDWILLDPAQQWVCRGYCHGHSAGGVTFPNTQAEFGVIRYEGEIDGVPALATAEFFAIKNGERLRERKFKVTRIEAATVPPEEFTLTALGLPEIEETVSRVRYYVVALLILAAVALVTYFALQRRARLSKGT